MALLQQYTRFNDMNNTYYRKNIYGFSLLELLIIAAIVAVIAAFSIPSYMNYIDQTKINTLWQQAEAAKLVVESRYLKQNTFPSNITINSGAAEYTTANIDFAKCITIQNGVVSVVATPSKFGNKSIWIAWSPTVTQGIINWACTYSTDTTQYINDIANTCSVYNLGTLPFANDPACN